MPRIIVHRHPTSQKLNGLEDEHATINDDGTATWRNPLSGRDEILPATAFGVGGPRR